VLYSLILSAVLSGGDLVVTYVAPAYDVYTQLPCDVAPKVTEHTGYITPEVEAMEKASEVKQVTARRTKKGLLGRTKVIEHTTVMDVAGNSEACANGSCANAGDCTNGSCGAGGCSSGSCGSSSMRSTEVGSDYGSGCSSGSCGSSGSMKRGLFGRRGMRSGGSCGSGGCN
jgi:hypothetical protein